MSGLKLVEDMEDSPSDASISSNSSDSAASPTSSVSDMASVIVNNEYLYDYEDTEPIASEQERAEYRHQVEDEDEEERLLHSRFNGESEVHSWYDY